MDAECGAFGYIRALPVKTKGELPMIPVDERPSEVRAIKNGLIGPAIDEVLKSLKRTHCTETSFDSDSAPECQQLFF